jgi:CheY-like chemotaxis protein
MYNQRMRRKTILLIEDDLPIIDIYKTALEKSNNFKVEAMTLGLQALERIEKISNPKSRAAPPDLILLDIVFPDISGIQILEELKRHKETKDIPVFVLTNYGDKKVKERSKEFDVEEYITKTECPPSQLAALIKKRLGKK